MISIIRFKTLFFKKDYDLNNKAPPKPNNNTTKNKKLRIT
jgi:hypothetical protein